MTSHRFPRTRQHTSEVKTPKPRASSRQLSHSDRPALLEKLQALLGYHFRDEKLLNLALTHSSVAYEEQQAHHPQDDNEQMEFLGDAVLGMVVTEHLFLAYPEFSEGPLTRLRARLVSRPHLSNVAQKLGLGEYLWLGKGEEKSGGRRKSAILANAVEALIAATYLDGGMAEATRLIQTWLLDEKLGALVAAARSGEDVGDYKSTLQEYFQAHGLGQPVYEVTSETGPDHRKNFAVAVKRKEPDGAEKILGSATGTRKKHAEQDAARMALEQLREAVPTIERPAVERQA